MKKTAVLLLALFSIGLNAQEVVGDWYGALNVQGTTLNLIFHISSENGAYSSTMDSPDQGAFGIPMDETTYANGEILISSTTLGAEYSGGLNQAGDTLFGVFNQSGMSFELILTREADEQEAINRPQEPTSFHYSVEEVKFENPTGGHVLAGTLTTPKNGKFKKVVILISGSGPQDRNEEVFSHKPFLVLSDYLTRKGIAVLRYDDRGIGESEGDFNLATTADFAEDAAAAVAYLKSRKDMKGKSIGLAGHSEGGLIAPMVASNNKNVDFIVLLAGPGIPNSELLLIQQKLIAKVQGVPESFIEANTEISGELYDFIGTLTDLSSEDREEKLGLYLDEKYMEMPTEMQQMLGPKENFIAQQSRVASSDWFVYFIRTDPDDYLSKVKVPVLAVNGELDLQVSATENLEGIQHSLSKAKNKKVTIREFKGLNHLFQKSQTGAPSEYGNLEETFNIGAMDYIANWILEL